MITNQQHKMTLTTPSDREIVLQRTFDAPAALVFEAMTKPEHVRRWFGCSQASLTVCEIDLRVGGAYRYVMSMGDGQEFPFKGEYKEITPPSRLVFTQIFDVPPINEHPALVTATFEERDGQTTLTETILHDSRESRDGHLSSDMEQGAGEAYDRLADVVDELQSH